MAKNKLLSIGEISKATGAGIKALRHYERIGILQPAKVDPQNNYRYYKPEQVYHIMVIMFCVELGIPLKELGQFIDQDTINYRAFVAKGKAIAEKKLRKLQEGLLLVQEIEQRLNLAEQFQIKQIYQRSFPKMYLHTKACGPSLQDVDPIKLMEAFNSFPEHNLAEYGFLYEHRAKEADCGQYHAFIELPENEAKYATKTIPAGTYHCRQSDAHQIWRISEIFHKQIQNSTNYVAIEVEDIFTGRQKISQPLSEIRLITL